MANTSMGTASGCFTVLPFYGTGAVFFMVLSILLLFASSELTGHYFNPHLLAIVHTAALGWGTMVIFGAAYQLLPVICERDLYSIPMAFASYLLLTVGTALLIWSFWKFDTGMAMIVGGALVVLAALLYAINACCTTFSYAQDTICKYFIVSSALWLVITTTIGLLLAINLGHTFIPRNHLDILKLHAHAGLAGWFLQLVTGVSIKLVPMFLLGKSSKNKLLYAALFLQNIGLLLFLADGYFNPIDGMMLSYAAIVALGVVAWLFYLYDAYRNRIRKRVGILMQHTGISMVCLLSGLALLPVTYYTAATKWTALYGAFLFLGWITAIILGKTFKTLPFIVWSKHYGKINGMVKVPLPKALYSERLTVYQFYLYLSAFILLVIGMAVDWLPLIRTALSLWVVLAAVYVINVAKVIFHKSVVANGNIT